MSEEVKRRVDAIWEDLAIPLPGGPQTPGRR